MSADDPNAPTMTTPDPAHPSGAETPTSPPPPPQPPQSPSPQPPQSPSPQPPQSPPPAQSPQSPSPQPPQSPPPQPPQSPSPQPPQSPPQQSSPPDPVEVLAYDLALAEAKKPLEKPTADIHSSAADKAAARAALEKAYAAARAADGALWIKFEAAAKAFERAAVDMERDGVLDAWIAGPLGADGVVRKVLAQRKLLGGKLAPAAGDNEKARAEAQAKTKQWAAWFADWSAPVDKMTAQIGQYADKIDKLNGDINNDVARASALLSFWFEVAPKHLQLAPDLAAPVKAVVDKVAGALDDNPDLKGQFTIGPERNDGSLYLIDADNFAEKRQVVLAKWSEAAARQATAEAAFKLYPDDAATLKQTFEKLKGDAWITEAKKQLS